MQGAIWHYTDISGAQHGPVTAEAIRDAVRAGSIGATSEFWRDGMASWVPLARVAAELGVAGPEMPPPDPYAAPSAPVTSWTPGVVASDDVVPAGFVRRFVALVLDWLILLIPMVVLVTVFSVALVGMASAGTGTEPTMALVLLYYVAYFGIAGLYFAVQESSSHQATLGKRALGIKVADMDGQPLTFGHALGRWAAAALSYLTIYIGFLMAAFTDRKRALHDFVAGTQVVDRWAYTANPERQKRELSGCLIAVLVVLLLVPFGVAVLAAISVSQYQDYVARSQVHEGMSLMDGMKTAVAEYYHNKGEFPADNEAAGLAAPEEISGMYVARMDVRPDGSIEATYSAQSPHTAHAVLDGASLVTSPTVSGDSIQWSCHSETIPQKHCPSSCACQ
jgi:uncharacterized RDD family membrane protein YckC